MKQQYLIYGLIAVVAIVLFAWTKLKNQKPQRIYRLTTGGCFFAGSEGCKNQVPVVGR